MIDLLYVSFQRQAMTEASFEALLANTDWTQVAHLFVLDDGSTDGTMGYLHQAITRVPVPNTLRTGGLGGPVAAMNYALDRRSDGVEILGKIDNDFVVPPGWLPEMLKQMTLHPGLDVLGTEPMRGNPQPCPYPGRTISEPVEHVGGKGLIRTRIFSQCRPVPHGAHGYQGWTQYQHTHPEISKAWIEPDLQSFGLDQIGYEPWRGLTDDYVADGVMRRWSEYANGGIDYCGWWLDA